MQKEKKLTTLWLKAKGLVGMGGGAPALGEEVVKKCLLEIFDERPGVSKQQALEMADQVIEILRIVDVHTLGVDQILGAVDGMP